MSSADRLFETLDPTTRAYVFGGRAYTLTDTVGFIRKLPHGLVEAFASTLEETIAGDLIIHVADASAPEEERLAQQHAVEEVLDEIGAGEIARLLVLNKADLLDPLSRAGGSRTRNPDAVLTAARTGEGLEELEAKIADFFANRFEPIELLVPHGAGQGAGRRCTRWAHRSSARTRAEGVVIRAHLPEAEARRFARFRTDGCAEWSCRSRSCTPTRACPARRARASTPASTCAASRRCEIAARATRGRWCRSASPSRSRPATPAS